MIRMMYINIKIKNDGKSEKRVREEKEEEEEKRMSKRFGSLRTFHHVPTLTLTLTLLRYNASSFSKLFYNGFNFKCLQQVMS